MWHSPPGRGARVGLDGRVAVVTGAGRGLGRAHALELAGHGCRVVVNDTGAAIDGTGADAGLAEAVAAEIRDAGGEAVASRDDVATWEGGRRVVATAVDTWGDLHVLVNNAGILRDRLLVNMSEDDWDAVVSVHLKGHFVPLRHAAAHWRERHHAGDAVSASVINTSSTSGLAGNPGQANYGTAKAGIAALTVIAAQELGRYGVRVNAIAPAARTRLTESAPGLGEIVAAPDGARFDEWDPANVAPVVAWLADPATAVTGRVFYAFGGVVQPMRGWSREPGVEQAGRWRSGELAERLPPLLG
ncbi:MAG TPA: SDR family oxidoreductase [Acidimicrobiales bacterium]|nr:SDR family oxidoreductase [Acidimicrobiales bacterium]